jgi:hypothetical protein
LRRVLYDPEKCRVFAANCSDQADRALDPSNRRAWIDWPSNGSTLLPT